MITGRAVRVKSQLKSHKRFATAFHSYCNLVDNARLYCTNSTGAAKVSLPMHSVFGYRCCYRGQFYNIRHIEK